jgi:HrpA-like RNA helicase
VQPESCHGHRRFDGCPPRLRWDDCAAARRFQRVCAMLDATGKFKPGQPREWYHGPSFHAFAQENEDMQEPPPHRHHHSEQMNTINASAATPRTGRTAMPRTVACGPAGAFEEGQPNCDVALDVLPIDAHRAEILAHIHTHRVTVIQGETGCGKSSRLPAMLIRDVSLAGRGKMMVAQPRRIAAHSLMQRAKQDGLSDVVGMRMGHGVREEQRTTRLWYVTTGYLVRLCAHRPQTFADHTHLVIDEVHERSVDSDLLCMLARRLLEQHPQLKLILMSATVHTELYQQYFSSYDVGPSLFVGARRFPVRICHADDLMELGLPQRMQGVLNALFRACVPGQLDVPSSVAQHQHTLACWLTRLVAKEGSAVLIFVSGLADIEALMEKFEEANAERYRCLPIHSDIPFEEQLAVFNPAAPGEVKVVIATNAAESSITLPDVDHVICFGTHKQVRYNERHHQTQLINTWISKASATQRAGRTGRVRPGNAYRLYPAALHASLPEHECSEIHRQPLDATLLQLRAMLDQPVVPLLAETLEPPDLSHVDRAFESLFKIGMISTPSDQGTLTQTGLFAAALPVDLRLSRMVALAVTLDCVPEALVLAAALTLARSPFRIASPLVHKDPDEYNHIARLSFCGQVNFDRGLYSTPLQLLSVYSWWRHIHPGSKRRRCSEMGLAYSQCTRLKTTVDSLRKSAAKLLGVEADSLELRRSSVECPQMLLKLRLLLVWAFPDNIMEASDVKISKNDLPSHSVGLSGPSLTKSQLVDIFPPEAQDFELTDSTTESLHATGTMDRTYLEAILAMAGVSGLVSHTSVDLCILNYCQQQIALSVPAELADQVLSLLPEILRGANRVQGRVGQQLFAERHLYDIPMKGQSKAKLKALKWFKSRRGVGVDISTLFLSMSQNSCTLVYNGNRDNMPDELALQDWFGLEAKWSRQTTHRPQTLVFRTATHVDADSTIDEKGEAQDEIAPLICDRPLGMRVLIAIAHGYRDNRLRLWNPSVGNGRQEKLEIGLTALKKYHPPGLKWVHTLGPVLMPRHTPLTVAVDLGKRALYAVSTAVMMIGKEPQQRLAVENVTLLPPGREWLALALRCIGHQDPRIVLADDFDPDEHDAEDMFVGALGSFYGLSTLTAMETAALAPLRAAELRLLLGRAMIFSASVTYCMSHDLHEVIGEFLDTTRVHDALQSRREKACTRADAIADKLGDDTRAMHHDHSLWAEILSLLGPHCELDGAVAKRNDTCVADDLQDDVEEDLVVQFLLGMLACRPGGCVERASARAAVESQGFPVRLLTRRWLENVAGLHVHGKFIYLAPPEAPSSPEVSSAEARSGRATLLSSASTEAELALEPEPECYGHMAEANRSGRRIATNQLKPELPAAGSREWPATVAAAKEYVKMERDAWVCWLQTVESLDTVQDWDALYCQFQRQHEERSTVVSAHHHDVARCPSHMQSADAGKPGMPKSVQTVATPLRLTGRLARRAKAQLARSLMQSDAASGISADVGATMVTCNLSTCAPPTAAQRCADAAIIPNVREGSQASNDLETFELQLQKMLQERAGEHEDTGASRAIKTAVEDDQAQPIIRTTPGGGMAVSTRSPDPVATEELHSSAKSISDEAAGLTKITVHVAESQDTSRVFPITVKRPDVCTVHRVKAALVELTGVAIEQQMLSILSAAGTGPPSVPLQDSHSLAASGISDGSRLLLTTLPPPLQSRTGAAQERVAHETQLAHEPHLASTWQDELRALLQKRTSPS